MRIGLEVNPLISQKTTNVWYHKEHVACLEIDINKRDTIGPNTQAQKFLLEPYKDSRSFSLKHKCIMLNMDMVW